MELALVGHVLGDEQSFDVDDVVRRLQVDTWSTVYADPSASAFAFALGAELGIHVAVEPELSLSDVVRRNAGRNVVAVCGQESTRAFIARAAGVDQDVVPIPRRGSLSRVRVSRSGTFSLMSLNETLYLHRSSSKKGGIE